MLILRQLQQQRQQSLLVAPKRRGVAVNTADVVDILLVCPRLLLELTCSVPIFFLPRQCKTQGTTYTLSLTLYLVLTNSRCISLSTYISSALSLSSSLTLPGSLTRSLVLSTSLSSWIGSRSVAPWIFLDHYGSLFHFVFLYCCLSF